MFRPTLLLLSAAVLTACATTDTAETNPNATTIEVVAPEPVMADTKRRAPKIMKDVSGKTLEYAPATEGVVSSDMTNDKMTNKDMADAAPKLENLYYTAQTKWEMMRFIEAVNSAELATALEADGALTVFAPTSDAFAAAGDTAATAELLKGHIVSGKLMAEDLMARAAKGETSLPTLAGTELSLYIMGDAVKVADPSGRLYTVVQADAEASNGVLHMINGVLAGE